MTTTAKLEAVREILLVRLSESDDFASVRESTDGLFGSTAAGDLFSLTFNHRTAIAGVKGEHRVRTLPVDGDEMAWADAAGDLLYKLI